MSMSHVDAGRLSRLSTLQEEITEFFKKERPKILEQRKENGYNYTRFDAAWADGAKVREYCKPTGRNGSYEL